MSTTVAPIRETEFSAEGGPEKAVQIVSPPGVGKVAPIQSALRPANTWHVAWAEVRGSGLDILLLIPPYRTAQGNFSLLREESLAPLRLMCDRGQGTV
jgi:hypothetical protein